MFTKQQRINSVLFQKVFASGKKIHGEGFFVAYLLLPDQSEVMFGVSVSKKISNTAIGRNHIKRQARAVLKEYNNLKPGAYILVYKQLDINLDNIEPVLKRIFSIVLQYCVYWFATMSACTKPTLSFRSSLCSARCRLC